MSFAYHLVDFSSCHLSESMIGRQSKIKNKLKENQSECIRLEKTKTLNHISGYPPLDRKKWNT